MADMAAAPRVWALPWRGAVAPLVLLVLIEAAMRWFDVRSDGLARPGDVAIAGAQALRDGSLLRATWQTLGCAFAGLAIGAGIGTLMGFWLGLSQRAARLALVSIELFRPVPPVALIPVAMLVFGLGWRMEIAIVAFTCFWPMLLLTQAAVRAVEPRLLEVARLLRLSGRDTVKKIVWPAALPRIVVALRLSLGIALIVAVTTEIATNPLGLGYTMMRAQQELQPATMYAFLVWLALLGWALNATLLALHRRAFARHGAAS
jgi:ABC-type nitrate/sulfonate/bicarbonate transport system permease component